MVMDRMKWNSSPGPTSMVARPGLRSASRRPVVRDAHPSPGVGDVQAHPAVGRVRANDNNTLAVTPYRPQAPITHLPLLILCAGFRNWPFLNRIFDSQKKRNFNSDRSLTAAKNRSEMPVQYTLKVPSAPAISSSSRNAPVVSTPKCGASLRHSFQSTEGAGSAISATGNLRLNLGQPLASP